MMTPRAVFQHQTVAGLAAVAVATAEAVPRREPRRARSATLPLTPIMHWQRDAWWPAGAVPPVDAGAGAGGASARRIWVRLQAVLDHHDALRLRLSWERGSRALQVLPVGSVLGRAVCGVLMSGVGDAALRARIAAGGVRARSIGCRLAVG